MAGVLPADIYRHIFTYLPQTDRQTCRLLDRATGSLATEATFHHVRLEATSTEKIARFESIAGSPHLRALVRELTVDSWIGRDYDDDDDDGYDFPVGFLRSLPHLRQFKGLRTLNVRFREYDGDPTDGDREDDAAETYEFRRWVLRVVFECLAGSWNKGSKHELEEYCKEIQDDESEDDEKDTEGDVVDAGADAGGEEHEESRNMEPIEIRTLTILNLYDYDDKLLTDSSAFKSVLANPSLTELKLFITTEEIDGAPEMATYLPEKYDFMESLPQTWLAQPVAQNLRTLSMYDSSYWGWNPKMDFRCVNPTAGGFPNLRVLALGNYVFSHEWQVDWIASLGSQNGRGGLQELYLDDCPILWRARVHGPLDESATVLQTGEHSVKDRGEQSESGNGTITLSNEGYPRKDVMTSQSRRYDEVNQVYPLRWHAVLEHWKARMVALRRFRMGHGDWADSNLTSIWDDNQDALWPAPTAGSISDPSPSALQTAIERHARECELHNERSPGTFLMYDCPTPPEGCSSWVPDPEVFRYGVGFEEERQHVLQYVHFDIGLGPSPWIERDDRRRAVDEERVKEYDLSRKQDEEALRELQEVVATRTYHG